MCEGEGDEEDPGKMQLTTKWPACTIETDSYFVGRLQNPTIYTLRHNMFWVYGANPLFIDHMALSV